MSTSGNRAAFLVIRGTPAFYKGCGELQRASVTRPRLLPELRLKVALDADVGDHPLLGLDPVEVLFFTY